MYSITGNITRLFPSFRSQDRITAILRNFSSSNNGSKWEISYDFKHFYDESFTVLLHANGNCKDNEGYVSIIFSKFKYNAYLPRGSTTYGETHCYVSVVDVSGNKRFTQSFVCTDALFVQQDYQFVLERFVKRQTLLNDPLELLPEDCLTICLDIDKIEGPRRRDTCKLQMDEFVLLDKDAFVALDSDFGRELCRVSKFFRGASDVPMMESRTRKVRIDKGELVTFENIQLIFDEYELPHISMEILCGLYRVADKYDIQPIIETYREFVKALLLSADDPKFWKIENKVVRQILELSENYRDDDLKETLQTYLESKENFGTNYHELGKHLKEKFHTEWKCEFRDLFWVNENISDSDYYFRMRRRIIDPEFQFYQ